MTQRPAIWWDADDFVAAERVERLGGTAIVEEIVHSILPDRSVKLRSLPQGISGATVFLAYPTRHDLDVPVRELVGVLKIGPDPQIAKEADNYARWVEPILPDTHTFPLLTVERSTKRRPLGALFYRRVGETTLGARIRELESEGDRSRVTALLDGLFTALGPWYEIAYPDTTKELTAEGLYSFGESPFDTFETVCEDLNQRYPHEPIRDYHAPREMWESARLEPARMLLAVTHGDLTTENVLVGVDNSITLIDFGAVGISHFLRDLATLEAHVAYRALTPPSGSSEAVHREYLEQVMALYDRDLLFENFDENGPLVHHITGELRKYAWLALMRRNDEYAAQYVFAVLRHAIRLASRLDEGMNDRRRWVAAHAAVRLAARLDVRGGRLRLLEPTASSSSVAFTGKAAVPVLVASDERDRWLLGAVGRVTIPRIAVVGAVKSGKSTYFAGLPTRQPHLPVEGITYLYWDLVDTPDAAKAERFRERLFRLFGAELDGRRPIHALKDVLQRDFAEVRPVLVLDHWDDAREYSDTFVSIEALQELTDFVGNQDPSQPRGTGVLGLIVVTRFPNVDLLVHYAHRRRSPGLVRISGEIERLFQVSTIPMLDWKSAIAFLESKGCDGETAARIAADCGGWIGLLELAVIATKEEAGKWSHLTGDRVRERLPKLLGKTLLPEIREFRGLSSDAAAWRSVATDLAGGGTDPERFGLPRALSSAQGTSVQLAPILRTYELRSTAADAGDRSVRARPRFGAEPAEAIVAAGGSEFASGRLRALLVGTTEASAVDRREWLGATRIALEVLTPESLRRLIGSPRARGSRQRKNSLGVPKPDDLQFVERFPALEPITDPEARIMALVRLVYETARLHGDREGEWVKEPSDWTKLAWYCLLRLTPHDDHEQTEDLRLRVFRLNPRRAAVGSNRSARYTYSELRSMDPSELQEILASIQRPEADPERDKALRVGATRALALVMRQWRGHLETALSAIPPGRLQADARS